MAFYSRHFAVDLPCLLGQVHDEHRRPGSDFTSSPEQIIIVLPIHRYRQLSSEMGNLHTLNVLRKPKKIRRTPLQSACHQFPSKLETP